MDETRFYGLEVDQLLTTKQLERRKKDNERIIIVVYCNGHGFDKVPLWIIRKYVNNKYLKMWILAILIVIIELTRNYG